MLDSNTSNLGSQPFSWALYYTTSKKYTILDLKKIILANTYIPIAFDDVKTSVWKSSYPIAWDLAQYLKLAYTEDNLWFNKAEKKCHN